MELVVITSIFLGIGLAMDACAVSMANGLNEPKMKLNKIILIALMFGLFQGAMPFIGYLVGSVCLSQIEWIIPWVALILLGFIGGKMVFEGFKHDDEKEDVKKLTFKVLFIQAIATSIDALSVGFTIADMNFIEAFVCCMIIAVITFIICFIGVFIGKKFGSKFNNNAELVGGIILIIIGLEIFLTNIL